MNSQISYLTEQHLASVAEAFDESLPKHTWAARQYRRILANYYRLIIPKDASILEVGCGDGSLFEFLPNRDVTGIDVSARAINEARVRVPHGTFNVVSGEAMAFDRNFDYIVISDTINFAADVQAMFAQAAKAALPHTRIVINFYSMLWKPLFALGNFLKLRRKNPPMNWLTVQDVRNLLYLAGWEMFKNESKILLPIQIPAITLLVNRWFSPILSWFCLTNFCIGRPFKRGERQEYKVSVIVPARNEAGNIRDIITRTPKMGLGTELVFVEGNSTDNTWEQIQLVAKENRGKDIKILQQSGKGKGNAVREGFAAASGEVFMILDADLTVPPEDLPKFYEVIAANYGEFANGVRLVYPMESQAMRFLNLCANRIFGLIFSWLLLQPVKDTLCGTKVLLRENYERVVRNRAYFGDFDPFGDFDLLFGADKLNLKITDVPIRYRDRTYGETNIHRWRHGLLLARMVVFAARKLKFV